MSGDEDGRKIFEHFIIAGLNENPEELILLEHESGNKADLPPITDITVIFPGHGERVPDDFTCIKTTPSGYPADLNHGSIRTPSAFLCYRRGYHKPPLVDIGIMDAGKNEHPMKDSTVLNFTPHGRVANVSNTSNALYFTYRRYKVDGPPHQLVITDIAVIFSNKNEVPPHTFFKINRNLNRALVGSDIFICYKKTQSYCSKISYKPVILDSFPKIDSENSLAQNVPMFCLPMGALIESWNAEAGPPEQLFSTCVLTDAVGTKYYGASLTFYEKLNKELTPIQKELLASSPKNENGNLSSTRSDSQEQPVFTNKSICIVSLHPFFECFRRFLFYVYQISTFPNGQKIPIERFISHLMFEVPFPSPLRPRVLVQLGEHNMVFENHDDSQLPLSGAQFTEVLKCVGPETFVYLMNLALLEQKILIHSLRPWLLTVVAETICALMFPFNWQCPYIPQCPLAMAGVLQAPIPFIAGVDSRYFDLHEEIPADVTCVDLDTTSIRHSVNKKLLMHATPPNKHLKHLKLSLQNILERLKADDRERERLRRQKDASFGAVNVDVDQLYQMRKAANEMLIREAFLRFMCSIMAGYSSFLKPLKARDGSTADSSSTFDLAGFLRTREQASMEFYQRTSPQLIDLDGLLRSRDKATSMEFYRRFTATQFFIQFLEERSVISDKLRYNRFFDDCIKKCIVEGPNAKLLDRDGSSGNQTIVVQSPTLLTSKNAESEYEYNGFPAHFNHDLFESEEINEVLVSKAAAAAHEEEESGDAAVAASQST